METLKLATFLSLLYGVSCDILHHHLIESPKITNWGSWGELESCPVGTFVTGMQLKVEPAEGWKDDTGLNGIRLFCSRLGPTGKDESPTIISSSVGPFGEWKSIFRCEGENLNPETSAVVGFQLRIEIPKGMKDDTSTNNFRVFCQDLAEFQVENEGSQERLSETHIDVPKHLVIEGDGTGWGTWSDSQLCRNGYAICGMATQVDHGHGQGDTYDDTGLNNVRAECCKVRYHDRDFHEEKERPPKVSDSSNGVLFPDPIESARNLEKALLDMQRKSTTSSPEPPTDRTIPIVPPITVPEVLQVDQHSTDTPPKQENSDYDFEELAHHTALDTLWNNGGRLEVRSDFKPSSPDDISLNNAPNPIVPPEVESVLENGATDKDAGISFIGTSSTTTTTSTLPPPSTPSLNRSMGHKDSEGHDNLLLISSEATNVNHFCTPIGLYSMFSLAFFANYVLL